MIKYRQAYPPHQLFIFITNIVAKTIFIYIKKITCKPVTLANILIDLI